MILILGDIHGDLDILDQAVEMAQYNGACAVIQVGDMGWSEELIAELAVRNYPARFPSVTVYGIEGNHEVFEVIEHYTAPTEVAPGVFFIPRGWVHQIDGRQIAFCGGASSVDKDIRQKIGWYWSPKEVITPEQIEGIMDRKVDLMVTHCPPQSVIDDHFDPKALKYQFDLPLDWKDPSAALVEKAWESCGKPPLYCGHMHRKVVDGNVRILNINEVVAV